METGLRWGRRCIPLILTSPIPGTHSLPRRTSLPRGAPLTPSRVPTAPSGDESPSGFRGRHP